jgi:5-methylcytosine-specific restriction endonuclease McrA
VSCSSEAEGERNVRRAKSLSVYRSARWRALRRAVLLERPTCEEAGCFAQSVEVDHVKRIEEGGEPFDRANLQALCHPHHSAKTARETGFGGARG